MKTFVAVIVALVASVNMVVARPGGYTLNGGVYKFDPDRELDYMAHAQKAGKFAWSKKFEDELEQDDVNRGVRKAQYTPTFFTAPQHHAALQAAAVVPQQHQQQAAAVRAQRETPVAAGATQYNAPLYYQQYRH